MKVVIAGGTGSLGRRLADDFAGSGDDVVILTRAVRPHIEHRQVDWDGRTVGSWAAELAGATVINLADELVDRRANPKNIELLRRSRVEPTRALVEASLGLTTPLPFWLQMSTLAIYGDAGQDIIDEKHPAADGPPQMAGVARPWEQAVLGGLGLDDRVHRDEVVGPQLDLLSFPAGDAGHLGDHEAGSGAARPATTCHGSPRVAVRTSLAASSSTRGARAATVPWGGGLADRRPQPGVVRWVGEQHHGAHRTGPDRCGPRPRRTWPRR